MAEPRHHPWTHKHAPHRVKDIVGHDAAIARVLQYVKQYRPGTKPIMLLGKSGVGKTSIAHAAAHELDLELLEVNAADSRNKESIESIIGEASAQASLFFRGKLILIDEADGVSGTQDRGGIAALLAILPKSRHPIIITANDRDNDKLKPLLKASEVIDLVEVAHEHALARLTHIAAAESITVEREVLSAISRKSGGDLRAAINDLQSIAGAGKVGKEDVALLDSREAKEAMQAALMRIFKTTSADVALPSFDNVDADVDELLLWIDENIPREYSDPTDLARAFDALADADRFFGRIRRWQYYRYYVYIYNLLTAGVALAKDKRYAKPVEYKPTGRILKMWIYNQKNAKRKKLSGLLAPHLHTSSRRVRQDVLPYLKIAAQNDRKLRDSLCAIYAIDDETAEWFSG
ncbi:TPA: replication factor C large subunit [Candidatus Woesearchaeota archaeon]|nr:replication factor C large subunit [Candidatus Woesearchaeota archaeon]